MAFKSSLLSMFACFLLFTTKVASAETIIVEPYSPAHAPEKAPSHAPTKPPPAHSPGPVKTPPIHAPLKAPIHAPNKAPPAHYTPPPPVAHPILPYGCVPICEERCRNYHRKRPCMRVCTKCCDKRKCVPSGKEDNKCKNWDYVFIHGKKFQCP